MKLIEVRHIPEGADVGDFSKAVLSFGRIYSAPVIREKYISMLIGDVRYFVAWGAYAYFARGNRRSVRYAKWTVSDDKDWLLDA